MHHHHGSYPSKIETLGETALLLLLLAVATGMWVGRLVHPRPLESSALSPTSPFKITGTLTPAPPPTTGPSLRRIYGHSLVAGGIHSVAELLAVIKSDPQLAEHYKNFDQSKVHIVTLDHDVVAYVSYRLGQGIYWQARPSIIAKGEQVLTDGTNFIRVRCGNQIAYDRGFPTSSDEPEDLDTVMAVKYFDPAEPPTDKLTNSIPDAIPGPPYPVPATIGVLPAVMPSVGNFSGGPAPLVSGGSSGPVVPPCCVGGAGAPFIQQVPSSAGQSQFTADEFSTLSLTILGHSLSFPSEVLAGLAGLLLIIILRIAVWR